MSEDGKKDGGSEFYILCNRANRRQKRDRFEVFSR